MRAQYQNQEINMGTMLLIELEILFQFHQFLYFLLFSVWLWYCHLQEIYVCISLVTRVTKVYFFVVQSLSCVQPFATPRTAAGQAPLSCTISWSLLKLVSIESAMPSSHLISCCPGSPPALSLSQHRCLSQWVSSAHQAAKVLELQHQSLQWIFRVDFL